MNSGISIIIITFSKYPTGGGIDYDSLIAGSFGTDVFLDRNNPRMCVTINLIDDAFNEGNETLMVRMNIDPLIGAIIDGNFRFEPNVTEVVIEDLEGIRKNNANININSIIIIITLSHHTYFFAVTRTIQTISKCNLAPKFTLFM